MAIRQQTGRCLMPPNAQVVVQLDRAATPEGACRVKEPARVVRMWSVLYATDKELPRGRVPPLALARLRRSLGTIRAELEQSVSAALAAELRHLTTGGDAQQDISELRVEFSSLLGWTSGLVVEMLDQLEAAASDAKDPSE